MEYKTLMLVLLTTQTSNCVAELTGDNICPILLRETVSLRVKVKEPVTIREFTWCFRIPPRCSKYRVEMREKYKIQHEPRTRSTAACCSGYGPDMDGKLCVAVCSGGCLHGICEHPEKCSCEPGYTGQRCDTECEPGWFDASCSEKCICDNGASCHHVSGVCICTPGWRGARCDAQCARGSYGEGCLLECDCEGSPCHPVTGECETSSTTAREEVTSLAAAYRSWGDVTSLQSTAKKMRPSTLASAAEQHPSTIASDFFREDNVTFSTASGEDDSGISLSTAEEIVEKKLRSFEPNKSAGHPEEVVRPTGGPLSNTEEFSEKELHSFELNKTAGHPEEVVRPTGGPLSNTEEFSEKKLRSFEPNKSAGHPEEVVRPTGGPLSNTEEFSEKKLRSFEPNKSAGHPEEVVRPTGGPLSNTEEFSEKELHSFELNKTAGHPEEVVRPTGGPLSNTEEFSEKELHSFELNKTAGHPEEVVRPTGGPLSNTEEFSEKELHSFELNKTAGHPEEVVRPPGRLLDRTESPEDSPTTGDVSRYLDKPSAVTDVVGNDVGLAAGSPGGAAGGSPPPGSPDNDLQHLRQVKGAPPSRQPEPGDGAWLSGDLVSTSCVSAAVALVLILSAGLIVAVALRRRSAKLSQSATMSLFAYNGAFSETVFPAQRTQSSQVCGISLDTSSLPQNSRVNDQSGTLQRGENKPSCDLRDSMTSHYDIPPPARLSLQAEGRDSSDEPIYEEIPGLSSRGTISFLSFGGVLETSRV